MGGNRNLVGENTLVIPIHEMFLKENLYEAIRSARKCWRFVGNDLDAQLLLCSYGLEAYAYCALKPMPWTFKLGFDAIACLLGYPVLTAERLSQRSDELLEEKKRKEEKMKQA